MINVFGHRRSGVSFLINNLMLNFDLNEEIFKYYSHISDPLLSHIERSDINLYIIRDGRDVLLSTYYWYKTQPALVRYFENKYFRNFLFGEININDNRVFESALNDKNPLVKDQFTMPIIYWVKHVRGFIDANIENMYFVNFELLYTCTSEVLLDIGQYYGFTASRGYIVEFPEVVGYNKYKGTIGLWRSHFGPADRRLFWDKAGDLLLELGYSYD